MSAAPATGTFFWTRTDRGEQEVESFQGQVLRIGRGTNAELRFTERSIDLEHASISFDQGSYLLRDQRSTAGSWVNGERVRSVRLRDLDVIELGGFRLKVKWQLPTDPLFLQVEPLAFDPEISTVIHTFKASSHALEVLAELEAQRLTRDPRSDPSEVSTFIGRILPGLELPAGDTVILTRQLPAVRKPQVEGFTELLTIRPDPRPPVSAAPAGPGKGAPPLAMPVALPAGSLPPLPPSPPPLPTSAGLPPSLPPGAAAKAPPPARPPRAAGIDYGGSYLLPALPVKLGVALAAFLATGLFFFQLFAAQGGAMFAPGPLAAPHRATVKTCGECHSGFRPVSDLSCRSACHAGLGDHQDAAARDAGKMACTTCHTEHHGDAALALVSQNACASCHGRLDERLSGSAFANRVSDFEGSHPEFAIDTPDGRRRLSEPDGRQTDPGGLVNFDHLWHLTKLPAKNRQDCADCHRRDEKTQEILPLDFEISCQSCHSLLFDPRFPGEQTRHEGPREVYDFLTGLYLRNPQILGRLNPNERLAASASLVADQQLAKVAQVVGDRLLRDKCAKCHRFEAGGKRGDEAKVAPVKWRAPYLLHASFRHAPHLQIAECRQCHAGATASRKSEDLLLPGIATCQECHRSASSAKVDASKIGEAHCLNCHSYHPTPAEQVARRAGS